MAAKKLPANYLWLAKEPAPKMLVIARSAYGVKEISGTGHNAEILGWASYLGLREVYSTDEVPWCGLFMAWVAKKAGYKYPHAPLWALNWLQFGVKVPVAMLGDVLVFERRDDRGRLVGGHVGLYIGEDAVYYHVLGGNQGNEVSIRRLSKQRVKGIRRPEFKIGMPKNVRRIYLKSTGAVSTNEA